SSRRRTVGSSSQTSSPTSARAIASRMAWVGRVSVSERRSTTSCMGLPRGGLEALGRALAPIRVRVFLGHLAEHATRILGAAVTPVDLAEAVDGVGNYERTRVFLDDLLEARAGGARVALIDVVRGDPQLLLGQTAAANVDLGQRVGRVAALWILPHQHLEGLHGLASDLL